MKHYLTFLYLIAFSVYSTSAASEDRIKIDYSADNNPLLESIHSAAGQLVRSQLNTGFFPYDFNFSNGISTPMDDIEGMNLVRQTGAAFALSEYFSHFNSGPVQSSLSIFLDKTHSRSLPVGKGYLQTALEWSGLYNRWQMWMPLRRPLNALGLLYNTKGNGLLVTVENDYERAWSGATALTLYAALNYYAITGDDRFNASIRQWKDGLLALKVPGRGFREAPHYLTESDYVNSEAWLALAYYRTVFPEDAEMKQFLVELEEYLFERYGNGTRLKFFHWGLMASLERVKHKNSDRLDSFIQKLAIGYMEQNTNLGLTNHNTCGAVEGLASYVIYMNQENRSQEPIVEQVSERITTMMKMNRQLQITVGFANTLPAGTIYRDELEKYQGAFVLSLQNPLMQVDLTQHCLNAMLRMRAAGLSY